MMSNSFYDSVKRGVDVHLVFRLSVINELERLKENALGIVPELTWNDWGKVGGTLPRIAGIWTESFVWHRDLEYLGGYGRFIKINLPRNRTVTSGGLL
jgi:hypothetical protein